MSIWEKLLLLEDNLPNLKNGGNLDSEFPVNLGEFNFWMDSRGLYPEDGRWGWEDRIPEQCDIKNWVNGNFHRTGLSQRSYGKEYLSLMSWHHSLAIIIPLLPRQQYDNILPEASHLP